MRPGSPDRAPSESSADARRLALVGDGRGGSLVAAVRAGDQRAFGALFDAYYAPLCEFAAGYVGSDAVAEECVQDVFARLWEHRAEWEVRDTVQQYLYGAVRNQALNAVKHARVRERWAGAAAADPSLVAGHQSAPSSTEELAIASDFAAALTRAIAHLPQRQRQVCTLRWRQHLTYGEIAKIMGTTVKAVEMRLTHALKVLRRELAPYRK